MFGRMQTKGGYAQIPIYFPLAIHPLQGLNEFVDITEEEKRFLDMWKRFIRTDAVVVDDAIPGKCIEFIRSHRRELDGLRQQLLQHLMVFWENKLMPSSHILTCMEEYDSLTGGGKSTTT